MASTDGRDIYVGNYYRAIIRAAWEAALRRGTDLYADLLCFPEGDYACSLPSGVDGDYHIAWDDCDVIILWFDGARSFPDRRSYFDFGQTLCELPHESTIYCCSDVRALHSTYSDLDDPLRNCMFLGGIATPQDAANLLVRTNEPPVDYNSYLASAHWKEVRAAALDAAGHRCQLCNTTRRLQAHHRTYERIGHELAGDLIVLCGSCHATFHGRLKRDGS